MIPWAERVSKEKDLDKKKTKRGVIINIKKSQRTWKT